MSLTREFLDELGLNEEQISKIFSARGSEITDFKSQIDIFKRENEELKTQKNKLEELAGNVEEYKSKLEEFKATEQKRIEEENSKRKDLEITKNINDSLSEYQFVNDYTKNAIVNEIKSKINQDTYIGKGVKDIFAEVTKDKDGIYKNPNKEIVLPPTGNVVTPIDESEEQLRKLMGLPIKK